jgi:hypothetical protein
MQNVVGTNKKRFWVLVLDVALAVVLGTFLVLLLGLRERSASAQNEESPLALACVLTTRSFAMDIKLIAKLLVCCLRGLKRPF